ncbi:MAG: ribonuclease R [Clostridium sp.]
MGIKDTLLAFMGEDVYKPMDLSSLSRIFDVKKAEFKAFKMVLKDMEAEGLVMRNEKDKFALPEKFGYVRGKIQAHAKGFAFLIPENEGEKDVFIAGSALNGAMNGDKVIVQVTREDKGGIRKREGEVLSIVERANTTIIGEYEESRNFGFVIPEDTRLTQDIFVSKKERCGAKGGDIVIVEITKWPEGRRSPEGKIKEVLGKKGDKGLDILTIIKKHGLPEEFPQSVLNFADNIKEEIEEKEYKRRTDFRDLKMVTIDGEDAKDLDDAVSIERLDNGMYKLGVHIADVSHYVRENNPLDKEALNRATSVYLIDRVIPMLPKKLSNGICSLNPKVDRLTLSCIMTIDKKGKVVAHEIHEAIIRTNERMTYTDVTKILKDKDEEVIKRYDYLYDDFLAMEELATILNNRRMSRGSIDFDFPEAKITLDKMGKPIEIKPYPREISNRMIEEFMLVCNETVAEDMYWQKMPFVYRIHEDPDEEKLSKFREFVYNLGYPMKTNAEIHPKMMQEVLDKVKGKSEETIVSTLMLRSMMKARYAPECVGHFGLAAEYYCHFTSPIRRYPDLQIHRIIKENLNGKLEGKRLEKLKGIVEHASKQSSDMEKLATEAEREVDDLKKAEFMLDRVGEEFDGIISSVTSFGMFIELPSTIEGLVHITALDDDYYVYDEDHLSLIGERTKKIYKLGDNVHIKCSRVDIDNREVYFDLLSDEDEEEEKEETAKELIDRILDVKEDIKDLEKED